jgi:CheY-like chemotaxis protein
LAHALIVDDDHDGREPMAHVLRRAGHEVTCASDAKEALAVLTGQTPSVVILDLMMPEMDGAQLLEVIRSYLRWLAGTGEGLPQGAVQPEGPGGDGERGDRNGIAERPPRGAY